MEREVEAGGGTNYGESLKLQGQGRWVVTGSVLPRQSPLVGSGDSMVSTHSPSPLRLEIIACYSGLSLGAGVLAGFTSWAPRCPTNSGMVNGDA
jgi:hypothetical protein